MWQPLEDWLEKCPTADKWLQTSGIRQIAFDSYQSWTAISINIKDKSFTAVLDTQASHFISMNVGGRPDILESKVFGRIHRIACSNNQLFDTRC